MGAWVWGMLLLVSASCAASARREEELRVRMRGLKQLTLGLTASASFDVSSAFNAPADVPTWCGKPYMSS